MIHMMKLMDRAIKREDKFLEDVRKRYDNYNATKIINKYHSTTIDSCPRYEELPTLIESAIADFTTRFLVPAK